MLKTLGGVGSRGGKKKHESGNIFHSVNGRLDRITGLNGPLVDLEAIICSEAPEILSIITCQRIDRSFRIIALNWHGFYFK